MTSSERVAAIDPGRFRRVLGHFPTGVVCITAIDPTGAPAGMAVGSFTSVSLDPPLVAFLPDKSSSSFPKIREAGKFCVNVLASNQEPVCRAMAAKGTDKFAEISWSPAKTTGSPVIDGVVAWIDCDIETIHEAGDHYIVIGKVHELDVPADSNPLLFFQGGYGQFSSPSRVAPGEADLLEQLRMVDVARSELERLAADLDVEVLVSTVASEDELVTVGSAGSPRSEATGSRIGQRTPFVAPVGAGLLVAQDDAAVQAWIDRLGDVSDEDAAEYRQMVQRVRDRGWSVTLHSAEQAELERAIGAMSLDAPTPAQESAVRTAAHRLGTVTHEPADIAGDQRVRLIGAPVAGPGGRATLMFSLYGLPRTMKADEIDRYRDRLLAATSAVTDLIANRAG